MMTDTIADMLTRVRNAQRAQKKSVVVPYSRTKEAILKVFAEEGYVGDVSAEGDGASRQLHVTLKYFQGQGVIENLQRISRPGLRIYRGKDDLPKINAGLGVAIVSTPKGVMTDRAARALGQGGEVLCKIY
ncbi:SSU ribosomal protein S8p (S15Ae) [Thioalkalivibrio nitratireducens DSM 14787]|uniref:Small ribosomal subunit protein uS8 n=1 Tax=Thioalkalivibrio nitratireducens (strain DSM 14787 / UNIQEM 213 / ALEN2) TaxID=1255043 RepID=L0E0M7_THIND|nr:30S ribosomal protein S8 [Thioalkalivibrio nitratireducens]AGA34201.1 SSU ribosomal protein S8p (S15Ae) [Thioalkalivibrio nitratireducens DSM 14787]